MSKRHGNSRINIIRALFFENFIYLLVFVAAFPSLFLSHSFSWYSLRCNVSIISVGVLYLCLCVKPLLFLLLSVKCTYLFLSPVSKSIEWKHSLSYISLCACVCVDDEVAWQRIKNQPKKVNTRVACASMWLCSLDWHSHRMFCARGDKWAPGSLHSSTRIGTASSKHGGMNKLPLLLHTKMSFYRPLLIILCTFRQSLIIRTACHCFAWERVFHAIINMYVVCLCSSCT